jgi:hypothetical protein
VKIKHADAKRKKSLKVLLFGDSGTGKTHLALKATPKKTLIFDAEGGADFFEGRKGFDFDYVTDDEGLKTSSITELRSAISFLATPEGRKKYDTFIIDPISDIWDSIQAQRSEYKDVVNSKKSETRKREAVNETDLESFNQKDWGDMKRVYKNMMLDLKNLPQNIFLIAREKEISETKPDGSVIKTGEYTYEAEKNTKYATDFTIRLVFDEKLNKRRAHIVKSRAEGAEKGQVIDDPTFAIFDSVVNLMAGGTEIDKMSTRTENIFSEAENSDEMSKEEIISELHADIVNLYKELGEANKEKVMELFKKYEPTAGNPNKIKDVGELTKLKNELIAMKEVK